MARQDDPLDAVSDLVHRPPASALALWYADCGEIVLEPEPLRAPADSEALVRTLYSAVSRGTERLIFLGAVPESEWERMRAPMQRGRFPFPVKYGYCTVGLVERGPATLIGRAAFCLHPHQDWFVAPAHMVVPIPDHLPPKRATLAANMETALNAHWDAGTGPGDRVVVVGGGIVGLLTAYLAQRMPGVDCTLIDVSEGRRSLAAALAIPFARPEHTPADADVVFHTSASASGLDTALSAGGLEARIVELSWYGKREVPVSLGAAFHSRRLELASSQVGQVAASRRARWSHRRRLEKAIQLLDDPCLDALVAHEIPFHDAPLLLPSVFDDNAQDLPPVLRYLPPA